MLTKSAGIFVGVVSCIFEFFQLCIFAINILVKRDVRLKLNYNKESGKQWNTFTK